MKRIALFPGSFDPFTVGHESIVNRAIPLFDKIIIAVGHNSSKTSMFSLEQRLKWIKDIFIAENKIEVVDYTGLTVDFCQTVGANFLLRGLRTSADFEFERAIGQTNRTLNNRVETVFLLTEPLHTFINSTIVRDVIKNGGDASEFLPKGLNLKNIV